MRIYILAVVLLLAVFGSTALIAVLNFNLALVDDTLAVASEPVNLEAILASSHAVSPILPIGYNFPIVVNTGRDVVRGKPGIAFDGSNFLVPWFKGPDIYGARVSMDGRLLDTTPIAISIGLNESVAQPSVVFDGTNFFVVWVATRSGVDEVYGARVTPDGTVLDPEGIQITTGGHPKIRTPSVAFDGANLLITWRTNSNHIYATRVTTTGVNLDASMGFPIATTGSSYYPAAAFDGMNYLVVWHDSRSGSDNWDIYGARVTTGGNVIDPDGFVICDDPQNQEHSTVAFDGTNYLVVWYDWRPNADQIFGSVYGARVSPDGFVLDDPAFQIADRARGQIPPQVACSDKSCLVVWSEELNVSANFRLTDVYARRISREGEVLDQQGVPVATAFGHQFGPVLGYGDGRYLVAWSESTGRESASEAGVYAQLLQEVSSETMGGSPHGMNTFISSLRPSVSYEQATIDWVTETLPEGFYGSDGLAFNTANSYAVGCNIYHYDGIQWKREVDGDKNYAIWASSPDNIWAGGWCRSIFHYDGITWTHTGCWTSHDTWDVVTAIWGASPVDLWATADRGDLLRYDSAYNWNTFSTNLPYDFADLWGTAADNIYAVGERGTMIHYDGEGWNTVSGIPTIQTLNAIWGSGPDDIFAVGDWGTVIHYDGSKWNLQESGTTEHLFDVWGFDGSDVYAVGFDGTILHYNGSVWQHEHSGLNQDLLAVWGTLDLGTETKTVWVAGEGSLILKKTIPISVHHKYLPLVMRQQ